MGSLLGQVEPANTAEYLFNLVAILAGTILFAAVQGIICGVVTTGNPDEIAWRQQNDQLNWMMEDCQVPDKIRKCVRIFFRKSKKMLKRRAHDSLIDVCLSEELKGDVRYQMLHRWFVSVPWLAACKRDYLEDLSIRLRRHAYSPREEVVTRDDLVILLQGIVSRAGTFLPEGSHWGDVIITSQLLRDTRPATAITFCEVARLSRFDILDVAKRFPDSEAILKFRPPRYQFCLPRRFVRGRQRSRRR